ncbi:MAG: nitroreductase [Deltaproteobacteria bacterium CG_4_8_14_3_um_filter_51_11]|nr:nitroreductase [bacterium]OIP40552.1 MAG: nitroreductase [Desulfobacteraceae bacterium CG2_30_51_40]PIP46322.1 MAG: nitroreductase [Deltaproteobacteria bacterium CG23_combo_of_CG06-09_8_20_14_all_51_20]PIX20929.1 MAG: nitroreductase [Deltaproteobacteria bacterium CG_4_8_14_3_um_filter_51_11]PIY22172.1 MAG: nitroreductase [Deltaproteobacteria bacterium CG_4_10_14_3_um_filter_51_14]PJB36849.1 MAG: nitroreductase [Deltaproteobacteria bacterium CG_4_9_14_3_um_filter_51_14]
MDVLSAMKSRRSARAYLKRPVPRDLIEDIFTGAGRAPSAINLQPWEYTVLQGEEKDRLVRLLLKIHAERKVSCGPGTSGRLPERFAARSRLASKIMTPAIEKMGVPFNRFIEEGSCSFYGAPVAVIVTMDRLFPKIRYLDIGLSVAYLLLAAQGKGLSTCPIGLITAYGDEIAEAISLPESKEVVLGIAMGYADESAQVNCVKTDREPRQEIVSWYE